MGDLFEGVGFFEQVGGFGYNREVVFAVQLVLRCAVEFDDDVVIVAHDEEGWGTYQAEFGFGEVGVAVMGDYRGDVYVWIGSSLECSCGICVRVEVVDICVAKVVLGVYLGCDVEKLVSEQVDVEDVCLVGFFVDREQIEKQRVEVGGVQRGCDVLVAWVVL